MMQLPQEMEQFDTRATLLTIGCAVIRRSPSNLGLSEL